jgi:DNA-binding Lrp family transcriptional regulator
MKKKKLCLKTKCSECGRKLLFLQGYRHPVKGWKKCVCRNCWDRIEESERNYSNFILNATNKNKAGITCFVMINTKPKFEKKVCIGLSNYPEIIEIHQLLGRHDIIAKLKVKNYENLENFVTNNIRKIEGIKDTSTLTGAFSLA